MYGIGRCEAIDVMPFYTHSACVPRAAQTHTHKLCSICCFLFHTSVATPCFLLTPFAIVVESFIRIHSVKRLPLLSLLLLSPLPPPPPLLLLFSLFQAHQEQHDSTIFTHSFCITCAFTHLPLTQLPGWFDYMSFRSALTYVHVSLSQCICMYVCMHVCARVCVSVLSKTSTHRETHV